MSASEHAKFSALRVLCEDRRITNDQIGFILDLANEFARLNEAPQQLRRHTDQLLHISRQVIKDFSEIQPE